MNTIFIGNINDPRDIKCLNYEELDILASEIRHDLIETVAKNGGHLASNLGVVELTIALHRVFDLPNDKIVFDVGHQSYVHKILTGRRTVFSTLRSINGISGFPKRNESIYDSFDTGHSSTAISAALGLARARDRKGEKHAVIALVGDGALTGGMCYEALNDAGHSGTRMLVVLNDNEMSISKNVGALSRYLTKLRISSGYQNTKKKVKKMRRMPLLGKPVYRMMHGTKALLKTVFVREPDIGFFEALGFEYFGPIDGHDIRGMEEILTEAAKQDGPAVVHVITHKGAGYEIAENKPEQFHGTPPFYVETGDRIQKNYAPSFGHIMADQLAEMTEKDDRICAITAAMPLGTGLDHYGAVYPDRLIDVGIAEEHAVTMAAGLAQGGMRPYVAIYASFFQRCHDQMIHDVCMQDLPVVFLLDRAGIGSNDGPTHHGVFDFAQLLPIPNMQVFAPCDQWELKAMLNWTLTQKHPCAIRYARTAPDIDHECREFFPGKWSYIKKGKDCALLCVGTMVRLGIEIYRILLEHGIQADLINCSSVKPLDVEMLNNINKPFFTLEEHMIVGGFGNYVLQHCLEAGLQMPIKCFGLQQEYITHGNHDELMKLAGLSSEKISDDILQCLGKVQ